MSANIFRHLSNALRGILGGNQKLRCPICAGECSLLDPVDFNKSCEEAKGKYLPSAGVPVHYALCKQCGFCFAPELCAWKFDEFSEKIYNADYALVDPDYLDARPRDDAKNLISILDDSAKQIKHLDYGGGRGLLSKLLNEADWQSSSYDPFVDKGVVIKHLGKFDLITAFEVFEHVPDVHALMSTLRSLLNPDGVLLFTTLMSDGNIHRGLKLNWWYASPRNGHISLFSRNSLAVLAQQNGYQFGSFSDGFHIYCTTLPAWAEKMLNRQKVPGIHPPA